MTNGLYGYDKFVEASTVCDVSKFTLDSEPDLISEEQLRLASDSQLSAALWLIRDVQRQRAVDCGDPDALTEEAYLWGFDRQGRSSGPRLVQGLLICPGSKVEKSAQSHDCTFVSVEGEWVWAHPDVVSDHQRSVELGKTVRQSVTIVPAFDGMEIDVVSSSARSGPCRMRKVSSFVVKNGQLQATTTRTAKTGQHR